MTEEEKGTSSLQFYPCLDSEEMAEARRAELWISRQEAAYLGRSAVKAAEDGYYPVRHFDGTTSKVNWAEQVNKACFAKKSVPPKESLPKYKTNIYPQTKVQVANETTFQAAKRLISGGTKPLALNFANGIHPGGGFLNGAKAQEECLCRCSALYSTLAGDPMYDFHRSEPWGPEAASAWAILSPDVPVFRDDDGTELEEPYPLSFITCAAPYGPAIGTEKSARLLKPRIHRILQIAASHGYSSLVLGAWGCGAFELDPQRTAQDFREALEQDCFAGVFSAVVFAIVDWSPERRFLGPFRDVFAPLPPAVEAATSAEDREGRDAVAASAEENVLVPNDTLRALRGAIMIHNTDTNTTSDPTAKQDERSERSETKD